MALVIVTEAAAIFGEEAARELAGLLRVPAQVYRLSVQA